MARIDFEVTSVTGNFSVDTGESYAFCFPPVPTRTQTPTVTNSPSITPTKTVTQSITPTRTPTPTKDYAHGQSLYGDTSYTPSNTVSPFGTDNSFEQTFESEGFLYQLIAYNITWDANTRAVLGLRKISTVNNQQVGFAVTNIGASIYSPTEFDGTTLTVSLVAPAYYPPGGTVSTIGGQGVMRITIPGFQVTFNFYGTPGVNVNTNIARYVSNGTCTRIFAPRTIAGSGSYSPYLGYTVVNADGTNLGQSAEVPNLILGNTAQSITDIRFYNGVVHVFATNGWYSSSINICSIPPTFTTPTPLPYNFIGGSSAGAIPSGNMSSWQQGNLLWTIASVNSVRSLISLDLSQTPPTIQDNISLQGLQTASNPSINYNETGQNGPEFWLWGPHQNQTGLVHLLIVQLSTGTIISRSFNQLTQGVTLPFGTLPLAGNLQFLPNGGVLIPTNNGNTNNYLLVTDTY